MFELPLIRRNKNQQNNYLNKNKVCLHTVLIKITLKLI